MKLQDKMISRSTSLFKFLKRKQRYRIELLAKCNEELEAMKQRGNYECQSKPKSHRFMECDNCNAKLEIPKGVPHICGGFLERRVIDPNIDGMTPRINGERFTKVLFDQSGMVIERFETCLGEGLTLH